MSALGKAVQEVRFLLCQTSAGSQGLRDFVASNYQQLKKSNPGLPLLVREAEGVKAKVVARFGLGVEKAVEVEGLAKDKVGAAVKKLVESA